MEKENIDKLYDLIKKIPATSRNKEKIEEIKELIKQERFKDAIDKVRELGKNKIKITGAKSKVRRKKAEDNENDERLFPKKLSNLQLEYVFMGLLLTNPKSISRYYFLYEDCFFEDDNILNIYKSVLFTEGGSYTPEIAKQGFNFSKDSEEVYELKYQLKKAVAEEEFDMEKVYLELKKLFVLRKSYIGNPIKNIQKKIVDIIDYKLYDQMSVEEVESAVNQVTVTEKFKQSILNKGLTNFLEEENNNLTNGIDLPFPILTEVFKGIRKGETMAYAMPSNSGKSRFAINIAAYTAFVNKKKVLMISNEMSEEKMKLCLITTILNNPELQKLHGQKLHKSENEILDFKFRPDNEKETNLDEDGFILKGEKETHREFIERLSRISTEFNRTIEATDWVNKQINNSIYFINITDHTNDELKKVIMNYYYKEKIEYVFYDTLKTDTANIGNGEEIKRTATILSNIAQNFGIFICSSINSL